MAALRLAGDDMPALLQQNGTSLPSTATRPGQRRRPRFCACCASNGLKAPRPTWNTHVLGQFDKRLYADYHAFMAWLGTDRRDVDTLLNNAMGIGKMNFNVMAILDRGETRPTAIHSPARSTCARWPGKPF